MRQRRRRCQRLPFIGNENYSPSRNILKLSQPSHVCIKLLVHVGSEVFGRITDYELGSFCNERILPILLWGILILFTWVIAWHHLLLPCLISIESFISLLRPRCRQPLDLYLCYDVLLGFSLTLICRFCCGRR